VHPFLLNPLADTPDKERGAIYTKREVVEIMLDLLGYTSDRDLAKTSILEPSCGKGDFLLPIVERLLSSYLQHGGCPSAAYDNLKEAIRATEINEQSYLLTWAKIKKVIVAHGISPFDADLLTQSWLIHADFLLVKMPSGFDFIAGNPPYLRQEKIPDSLLLEYRRRFHTLYDRADIYVPFIERSLNLLRTNGQLSFICSDRWMKNRYGGPLRNLIASGFHLKLVISVNDVPAFTEEVCVYPAIFIIQNALCNDATRIAVPPKTLEQLKATANVMNLPVENDQFFREMSGVVLAGQPWLTEANSHIELIRRLERDYPTLEEAGCRVGIGVATGADGIYIGRYEDLDVEDERKVPLIGTKDICHGNVIWKGRGVVNPFEPDGSIADLEKYPRFKKFVLENEVLIRRRNVASRAGNNWYRTIDRIYTDLVTTPKLVIPDIKGTANVVYEEGRYYPHHNLYYVTSKTWELRPLQTILRSRLFQLFITAYSVKMQGGYLRFQAQYLRRLRLPKWENVPLDMRLALAKAAVGGDPTECDAAVAELFQLSDSELLTLRLFKYD